MAIYHLHGQIISRSKGHSVVAAAAYRAGEKIVNQYDGVIHDYTKKGGILHREILLAEGAPESYRERSALWNAAERSETRKNSQLGRELNVALPRELAAEDWTSLVREYVQGTFVRHGMCADIAIHDKRDGNPHAHILLTMRHVGPAGFGAKERGWNDQGNMEAWRKAWAGHVNGILEKKKTGHCVDHRSYQRQGLAKRATVHLGAAAKLEARGIRTERGDINREIAAENRALEQAEQELLQKAAELRREKAASGSKKAVTVWDKADLDTDFRVQEKKKTPTPQEIGLEMARLHNRYCRLAYLDLWEKHQREEKQWQLRQREEELRGQIDEIGKSLRDIAICRGKLPQLEEEHRKLGLFRRKARERLCLDMDLYAGAEEQAVRNLREKFESSPEEGRLVLGQMQRELAALLAEQERLAASPIDQSAEERIQIARRYKLRLMEMEVSPYRDTIERAKEQALAVGSEPEEQLPVQYQHELENAVKWLGGVSWDEVRELKAELKGATRLEWERLEVRQQEKEQMAAEQQGYRYDWDYEDEWDMLD